MSEGETFTMMFCRRCEDETGLILPLTGGETTSETSPDGVVWTTEHCPRGHSTITRADTGDLDLGVQREDAPRTDLGLFMEPFEEITEAGFRSVEWPSPRPPCSGMCDTDGGPHWHGDWP